MQVACHCRILYSLSIPASSSFRNAFSQSPNLTIECGISKSTQLFKLDAPDFFVRVDVKRTVGLSLISTDSWEGWQSVPRGDAQECLNKQPKTEERM